MSQCSLFDREDIALHRIQPQVMKGLQTERYRIYLQTAAEECCLSFVLFFFTLLFASADAFSFDTKTDLEECVCCLSSGLVSALSFLFRFVPFHLHL